MNLEKSKDRIKELMTRFVTEINVASAMGQTDINRESENVLIQLLSEIYGYTDLKNLNVSEVPNFPAIDLGDEKTGKAYQITSKANSRKIKDTLQKFVKYKLYEKYDHLIIYILTKKQRTYQGQGFDEIIQGKFTFDKENDILDYRDLLKEISGFSCVDKLRRIEDILEEHFGDPEYTRPLDPLDWLEKVNNLWGEELTTIKIDREKLRNDLQDFALRGSGVVIGSPGVGKTYLLKEVRQNLKSDGIPHLLLPIDKLGEGTDEDLQRELSTKRDLIEALKAVPVSDQKGILLFDTFDAARNEQTRRRFLRLIRRAIQELNGLWNVVVTVRTYDAEKSQEFLELFGSLDDADLTQYHSKGILYRHFEIPPLSKDEMPQVFDQISYLESVYNDGSPEFRQLLANPFNLWLLEKILKSPQDARALSQIHSEVQLLDVFWRQRVAPVSNRVHGLPILSQIVQQMVKIYSLTVKLDDISDNLGLDRSAREAAWDYLFSNEVLIWIASTGQHIAFSHDILFDYAISILFIEEEPQQLQGFILKDSSRTLFLRPSLTYFFARLWYDDDAPEKFWNAFWCVFRSNQSAHLRIARLIPTSVIANETRGIDQLKPLLEKLQNGEEIANETITCLLQLLRAMQIKHDPLWIDFFDQVSAHLHRDFAWDLATLTAEILERAKTEDTVVIDACGRVGRQLLAWVWEERETSETDWYRHLGSYWAIPLVAKTYGTKVRESRTLLEKVLALKREGHFPMDALTQLAEHIDKIWEDDPEFVGLIYRAGITSTRRQGHSMCQYWLVQHFPNFLQTEPLLATKAAIKSLNRFIIGNYAYGDHQESVETEGSRQIFSFRGRLVHLVEDRSHIGDDRGMLAEPVKMADTLFEFIKELATSKDPLLDSVLDVFYDHAEVAFFWKRLLRVATQFPETFAPHLLELFAAKPIQMNDVVFYQLCTFLGAAASKFTAEQQLQVEDTILKLPREETDENYRESLERRRNQLLTQIPPNLLLTDAAKEIQEEMERENSLPQKRSPVHFSTWVEPYTDEKWLQEQGIDTTTPENQEVQRFFEPLDKFRSDWQSKKPTEEAVGLILPMIQEGYATIIRDTRVNKAVIDLLWYKLTTCAAILAQVANNPESHLFTFCRQVLLHAAKHQLPEPNPEYDAQFDSAIYSPFPRHEASLGLLNLIARSPDADMLNAIETLASDPVPSVRMVTAGWLSLVSVKAPERFWHIMDRRATYETNHVVQEHLYATLNRVVAKDEEKTIRIMGKLLKRTLLSTDTLEPANSCIDLLMRLAIDRENPWALKTIENSFFNDPIRFANSLNHAVSRTMRGYVVPKELETSEGYERAKRAIAWIGKVVTVISGKIEELCATFAEPRTEQVKQQLRDIYGVIDEVVMCLFLEFAYESGGGERPTEKIPNELRCRFYYEVEPLMVQIVDFALDATKGVMFAPTARHFIEILTSFLSCDPKGILHLAQKVARSSKQSGYNFDSLAVRDVVKFVEIVLADHRNEVGEGEGLEDLLKLLDIFIEAGWEDALKLVWRLDEVFR